MLKKISLAASYLIVSLTGVSVTGATAVLDGALSVVSSDPGVLTVTPQEGGLFRVDLIGVGQAQLIVSGDADLGDGVRTISQEFGFEIYDPFTEADHFDLAIVEWQLRDAAELSDPSADSQAAGASETA